MPVDSWSFRWNCTKLCFQETPETEQNERKLYTYSESGHACINDEFLIWSGRNTEPVEEADMGVEVGCVEALHQPCQDKAKITRLAIDPAQCAVRREGAESAVVNWITSHTVVTRLKDNQT